MQLSQNQIRGGKTSVSNLQKQRDSNLELYRIIIMLLIVAHHYVVNSGLTLADGPIFSNSLSMRSLFLLVFGAFGKTGINCFVLITGYFMCKSQITAKKFAKLFFEFMFYRLVINSIFWITGYAQFSIKALFEILIPFTNIAHNFTGCYLVFFLCIPFFNILIRSLNEKQHIRLILICAFTYILFGTLPSFSVTMNYVSWYMVLYFIASYIRLYPKKIFENTKLWGLMALVSVALCVVSVIYCTWLGTKIGLNLSYFFVVDSNTFLAVLTGVTSFLFFKNLKIKYNPLINMLAASTFGVLCIHANSETMRQWLWKDILNNVGMYDSVFMPLHAIGSVLAIFIICAFIDYLRIKFVETPIMNVWDKHWQKVEDWFLKTESKICDKLRIN